MALQWTGALTPSLSGIDGKALCYPAFPQLALIHECHRDGVNCGAPAEARRSALGSYMLAGSTGSS
jgi:hypothetical protein